MGESKWPIARLGDICEIQLGKMLSPKSKQRHRPRPYLRNVNVQWNRFDLSEVVTMDFSEEEERRFRLRPGDLLVCEGGEPGRAAIWGGEIADCCYQKALHRLRPKPDVADPRFLMYRLWAGALAGEFTESHGKTTIAHLPAVRLRELRLVLPPIIEQRRIAAKLEAAMAAAARARAAARERLAAAKRLPEAHLREVFPVVPLVSGKPSEAAPPGWRWASLTDLARLESGHTPSRRRPEWWGGDVPWLALPDIRRLDGRVAFETAERTNEAGLANSAARLLPEGTVALSRTASVGFVTVFGRPMATSQDFVNWVCGPSLRPRFLLHLLRASRDYLRSIAAGATHKTIYMPAVEAFQVCIPAADEQDRIIAAIDAASEQSNRLTVTAASELSAVESLPAALLREAFAG